MSPRYRGSCSAISLTDRLELSVESTSRSRNLSTSSMSELTDFEKGKIVGARIGGMSVSETAELCNVSARTVMKVMSAYKNYGFTASAQKKKTRKPQKNSVANGKAARAKVVPESKVETQNPDEDMDTPEPKTQDDE